MDGETRGRSVTDADGPIRADLDEAAAAIINHDGERIQVMHMTAQDAEAVAAGELPLAEAHRITTCAKLDAVGIATENQNNLYWSAAASGRVLMFRYEDNLVGFPDIKKRRGKS